MASPGPLIAVVDDESPVRTMLGRLLQLADFQVAPFASGEEFLASLATRRPACVLLDINMAHLSGFDVQSRLRAAQYRIPVIFITASGEAVLDRSVADSGAVCLLRKPFSGATLFKALAIALEPSDQGAGSASAQEPNGRH